MFDKLRVGEPVVRFNYSIHDHDKLHLPDSRESCDLAIEKAMQGTNFIRSERQTLTCMPVSGDIVFTIDTSHRRVDDLSEQDKRVVESHLTSLSSKERQYKGFVEQAPMNKHQAD